MEETTGQLEWWEPLLPVLSIFLEADEKLKNFMFPVPRAPPPVDVDMLVASLFK